MAYETFTDAPEAPAAPTSKFETYSTPTAPGGPHNAQGFFEAIHAGYQASSGGLFLRHKAPDVFANPDAPWYDRMASNIAGLVGDAPAMIGGGLIGAAIPAPGAAKLMLGGAGAFMAPAVVREALMDYYTTGHVDPTKLAWTAAKSGIVGAATFGAGKLVGTLLPEATTLAGKVGAQAAIGGAELGAMTTAQSVLDWHLPSAQEFFDNAVLIFGVRGARTLGVPLLQSIYERTGKTPAEVATDAANDSKIAQDLHDGKVPDKYPLEAPAEAAKVRGEGERVEPRPVRDEMKSVDPSSADKARNDFNLRHFDSEEGMHSALQILADEEAVRIQLARRGVVGDKQTIQEGKLAAEEIAQQIGKGKETREIGDAASASKVIGYAKALTAMYQNVRQAAADLMTLEQGVKDGKATPEQMTSALGEYAVKEGQLKALMADYLGSTAEVGRALRAVRLIRDQLGDVSKLADLLNGISAPEKMGKGAAQGFLQRAAVIQETDSNKALAAIVKGSSMWDKVSEYWKASILSGPTTQVRNLVSNVFFGAARIPNTIFAAMVSEARGTDTVMYRQAFGEVYGAFMGITEGARAAARVISTHFVEGKETASEKGEQYTGRIGTDADSGAFAKGAGKVIRAPFAALSAMDAMSKTIVQYMTAYGAAARNTKGDFGKLFSSDYYTSTLRDEIDMNTGRVKDSAVNGLTKLMTEDALRYTFQSELSGPTKRVMSALYDLPGVRRVVPFLFPFVRTPLNIYQEAMRQLPLLGAFTKGQKEQWAKGGSARERVMAEHIAGTAMTTTVIALAQAGILTGGGPPTSDPTARRAWLQTHEPYSIRVGGKWYSYNYIEPFATSMGVAADLWAVKEYCSDAEYESAAHGVGAAFVNQVTNKTFLQTFATLGSLLDPNSMGGTAFGNVTSQVLGGFIPALVAQPAKVIDPQLREARTFVDRIANRVPLWRSGLIPQRDLFGEPIPHERVWDALGIKVMPVHTDPVHVELSRLGYAPQAWRNEPDTAATLPEAGKSPGMTVIAAGPLKGHAVISDQQFDAMRTKAGQMAYPMLQQVMSSQGYQQAPDAYKRAIVEQIFANTRLQAKFTTVTPDQIQDSLRDIRQQLNQP